MSHVDLNPYAVATLVLLACILVGTWPAGRARLRRHNLARVRRARRSEDRAWRRRAEEAELARSLRFARYDHALSLGDHSLSTSAPEEFALAPEEFALGLGEIDGGGA